ncbi:hypothetical protein [Streptomyces sp. PKU-MA01144]|uniref:hypothetical protein n=1 Tax=Streptomyces sp. PKU-MA01144 TaxID=2729138 RepID=UPI0020181F1D|nr:hypothetical protein [Streptomyces sp. PKU-MA01144]
MSAPDAATASRHTTRALRCDASGRHGVRYRPHDVRHRTDEVRYRPHDVRHRMDGVRHRHDEPRRTTAEEAHGARPSALPPAPGGHLPGTASPEPAAHGTVRVASARDAVRTPARAELPDVQGPPGTAGHRSRPTSPPARPS